MKRIALLIATNLAVMIVLSILVSVFGLNKFLVANGLNLPLLLAFSAVLGFGGAFISLLISKRMAKWSTGAHVIDQPGNETERWLVDTVKRLSEKAGIAMPEVALYEGAPNAFATGAFKNSALVAVSTGLLQSMSKDEVEAVLGHEVAHVANGDMVTLTLIQGVMNTFVYFAARVIGYLVDKLVFKTGRGVGAGYYITVVVLDIVFGIIAAMVVAYFSRWREYRADAGSATLVGDKQPMIHALARLGGMVPGELPKTFANSGINNKAGVMALFSSHPPIEARIQALQASA